MRHKYGAKPGISNWKHVPTGVIFMEKDKTGKYNNIIYYSRKLTTKELDEYEMDYLGEEE